jgi:hypothetical protein
VANVDQVQLVKSDRTSRVQIVLARPSVVYKLGKVKPKEFPVILVAGYSSLPEDFEEGLPAFESFLQRVAVEGRMGITLTPVPKDLPAAAATAAPDGTANVPPDASSEVATPSEATPPPASPPPPAGAPAAGSTPTPLTH